jgi:hypothetical protein
LEFVYFWNAGGAVGCPVLFLSDFIQVGARNIRSSFTQVEEEEKADCWWQGPIIRGNVLCWVMGIPFVDPL